MFIVVTGGSGSGKSAYAEGEVMKLQGDGRIYLATMMCFDEESRRRVERHRRMRAGKGFLTLERYTDLKHADIPKGCTLLLECMSNLTANEMFSPEGAGENTVQEILEGIWYLLGRVRHLVVVTNEIFSDGVEYSPETKKYQSFLGRINAEMGKRADRVVEVVYGIPLIVKETREGREPCIC